VPVPGRCADRIGRDWRLLAAQAQPPVEAVGPSRLTTTHLPRIIRRGGG
jgi:hypothetical protein